MVISTHTKRSEASKTMCILNLRLGFISRFIVQMRSLRSGGAIVIPSIGGRSFVAGWIWRLYHATESGRLFNYPVHLSSFWCEMSIKARFARRWNQKGSKTLPKSLHKAAITPKIGFPPLLYGYASEFRTKN